jgi:serine/threonine protein kinase
MLQCPRCNAAYEGSHECPADEASTDLTLDAARGKQSWQSLPPGTLVGEYRVTSLLGVGGMASVYAGIQPLIGKKVAIKCLHQTFARDSSVFERFVQEARAVNHIGHHNIVDIFGFGQLPDGRPYLVMEFLNGMSLKQRLRQSERLTYHEALDTLIQVCSALGAAHEAGIIHRDLKPENIVISETSEGRTVKLLDFGIAKLLHRPTDAQRTASGLTIGTPTYMSPEQCLCQPVDARSDLYSLGVIMFVVFAGRPPFTGTAEYKVLEGHVSRAPPRPREFTDIPAELEALILQCLTKSPALRPRSAYDLRARLLSIAEKLGSEGSQRLVEFHDSSEDSAPTPALLPNAEGGVEPSAQPSPSLPTEPGPRRGRWWPRVLTSLAILSAAVLVIAGRAGETRRDPSAADSLLIVTSEPSGATVELDGKTLSETTPTAVRSIAQGEHALRVHKIGYAQIERRVRMSAGERTAVELVLSMANHPIEVRSKPEGARMLLDGLLVDGITPLTIQVSDDEIHTLRLEKNGYESVVKSLDGRDRSPMLEIELLAESRPRGTLVIDASGPAEVWIDGVDTGFGTPTIPLWVAAGSHSIELRPSAGRAVTKRVTVNRGETVRLKLAVGDSNGKSQ